MKKFTLLELLVVIAIIGLLMSLLLPSLADGRKKAKLVVCTSNLSQWGKISYSFAKENDMRFPQMFKMSNGSGYHIRLINYTDESLEEDWKRYGTNWQTWTQYGLNADVSTCTDFYSDDFAGNDVTGATDTGLHNSFRLQPGGGGVGDGETQMWGGMVWTGYMYFGGMRPTGVYGAGIYNHAADMGTDVYTPPIKTIEDNMSERVLAADSFWDGGPVWNLKNIGHRSEKGSFAKYQNVLKGDGAVSIITRTRQPVESEKSVYNFRDSFYFHK